jgi:hypothetical protein
VVATQPLNFGTNILTGCRLIRRKVRTLCDHTRLSWSARGVTVLGCMFRSAQSPATRELMYIQTQSARHHHATHCLSPVSPSGCHMCSTVTTFQRQDPSPDADCSHKLWPRNRCALWGCAQTHSVLGRTERTKPASQLGPCFCGFPSARKRVRTHCAITLGCQTRGAGDAPATTSYSWLHISRSSESLEPNDLPCITSSCHYLSPASSSVSRGHMCPNDNASKGVQRRNNISARKLFTQDMNTQSVRTPGARFGGAQIRSLNSK